MPDWKFLDWRNRQDSSLNQADLPDADCESQPVLFPDNDTPVTIFFTASLSEITQMLSALEKGAQLSYPDTWHTPWWNFVKQWECPMDICETILACLQPAFDQINERLDDIEQTLDDLEDVTEQSIQSNSSRLPEDITDEDCLAEYAGALALVQQMDKNNRKYYDEAEGSFVDNASEALSIVLELFPDFQGQPYDEAFELGNAYFENQVLAYTTDYDAFEPLAACDLMTRIAGNGGTLTIDVWGDWLFNLPTLIPDNAAANVYTRYSPLRQTFLNQVAALFNKENSLDSYFQDLWQVYNAGVKQPVEELPEGCECPEFWCYQWDYESDQITGWNIGAGEFETGVGFVTEGTGEFPWSVDVGIDCDAWGDSELTGIEITAWTETADATGVKGAYYPPASETDFTPNTDEGNYVAFIEPEVAQPESIRVQVSNNLTPGNNRISRVKMTGNGELPGWFTGGSVC